LVEEAGRNDEVTQEGHMVSRGHGVGEMDKLTKRQKKGKERGSR